MKLEISEDIEGFIARGKELEERMQADPEFRKQIEAEDARLAAELAERERNADRAERIRRYEYRGIPQRYMLRLIGETPVDKTRPAFKAAMQFLAQADKHFLVLTGGVGCGKSFAAAFVIAHARRVANPDFRARFRDVGEIAAVPVFGEGSREWELLKQCEVLAIDDLGTEYADAGGHWLSKLDQLLNARYANALATVITTNLPTVPPEPFAKSLRSYGERIADRLREEGLIVNANAPSIRGKA